MNKLIAVRQVILRKIFTGSLLLCAFVFWAQPRPEEVRVTYMGHQQVKDILQELSTISGVGFAYSENSLNSLDSVHINVNNEKLGSVLSQILQPYGLSYRQVGDQLVIYKNGLGEGGESIRIYGYVRDVTSGEPLMGVNVYTYDKSRGTVTNSRGFYSLVIDKKISRIYYTYVGYASRIVDTDYEESSRLDIQLEPDGQLNEIVIRERTDHSAVNHPASYQNLSMDVVRTANHLAGEPDLLRYISTLHGISTASEGVGGLSVRGGSDDQNLVLLDGIPLYSSGHAMGVFSVFNGNSVKSSSIYRAGMPARYHGRLSSVFDIHTKDGNNQKPAADFTLSTIAFHGTIEGPIIKDKASYILSYRRTILDVWINELNRFLNTSNDRSGQTQYFFDDFNAKVKYELAKGSDIQIQAFHARDRFDFNRVGDSGLTDVSRRAIDQANRMYALKWNKRMSPEFFTHMTLYSTQNDLGSFRSRGFQNVNTIPDTLNYFEGLFFDSHLIENGLKADNDWMLSRSHYIRFGGSWLNRSLKPSTWIYSGGKSPDNAFDITPSEAQSLSSQQLFGHSEASVYAEDEFEVADGLKLNIGIISSSFFQDRRFSQTQLQPRLALVSSGEITSFKAGVSRMAQYVHRLNNSGLGFPTDIWMPSSDLLPVQSSWIYNMDFGLQLGKGYRLGLETYYKVFTSLHQQKEGTFLDLSDEFPWESTLSRGKGQAYGIDTYIEKTFGKLLFNANYSFSVSDRLFHEINNGQLFPFDVNRRHSLKTSVTYRMTEFSEFLFNWAYMSGTPFSRPDDQVVFVNGQPRVVFSSKNNDVFPDFHRLDLGISFYNVYRWGRVRLFLGVYNAYNRLNPFYTELVRSQGNAQKFEFRQYSLLPLLPTVSYSISL